ncbi:hypothetical protein SELMODRAFT_410367 [Selaginella moellendorffii]|uniref:Uncharacterized protein n=1 Tax=Selaginella moellendorffii TaxID=88036 RepID=D8REJ2_SELML|nr:hypothetical protein SELMODRAFT_410367 [Selaginella moellendorffii]
MQPIEVVENKKLLSTKLPSWLGVVKQLAGYCPAEDRCLEGSQRVKEEALRQKGPQLTATVTLAGRYWAGKKSAQATCQRAAFGLTVRTEAVGRSREELKKDLARLMETCGDSGGCWWWWLKRPSPCVIAKGHGAGKNSLCRLRQRLRGIGGIIVVDTEGPKFGLMEMTRARVSLVDLIWSFQDRLSVTDSCGCCGGTGRIESVEMTLSKIERRSWPTGRPSLALWRPVGGGA